MNGYNLFGLKVNSDIPLARFNKRNVYKIPDATIRMEAFEPPSTGQEKTYYHPFTTYNKDIYYQDIPSIVSFLIKGKSEVLVYPPHKSPKWKAISLFFIDTILPILLIKNGIFAVNASAVASPEGNVHLFTSIKGDGKSTLAAKLVLEGYNFISDDICIIKWNEEKKQFITKCFHPYVYLWRNVINIFNKQTKKRKLRFQQIRQGVLKYAIDMKKDSTQLYLPVESITIINVKNENIPIDTSPFKGMNKINISKKIIHSHHISNVVARHKELFQFSSRVAQSLRINMINRSRLTTINDFSKYVIDEVLKKTVTGIQQ